MTLMYEKDTSRARQDLGLLELLIESQSSQICCSGVPQIAR